MLKSTRVKLGDLSVGFVDSLADAMRHCAEDPQPLLDSYGLDAARLAEPRARLSIPRYMRLGHSAIQQCSEPGLGLLMGQTSRLSQLGLAFSQAAKPMYVQDRLLQDADKLVALLQQGAQVLVCGSRDMAAGVRNVLEPLLQQLGLNIGQLRQQGRYREDVY